MMNRSIAMPLAILLGCAEPPDAERLAQIYEIDAEVSDIVPTVVTIS